MTENVEVFVPEVEYQMSVDQKVLWLKLEALFTVARERMPSDMVYSVFLGFCTTMVRDEHGVAACREMLEKYAATVEQIDKVEKLAGHVRGT